MIPFYRKRVFLVLSLLILFGFAGCKANDVQVSDAQDTPPPPNAFPPSFVADDVLYCSTGLEVSVKADESKYLGEITSVGKAFRKPTQNGQANIPVEGAPYVQYEDGLALLWDERWILFEVREAK